MIDPDKFMVIAPDLQTKKPRDRTGEVRQAVADQVLRKVRITYERGGREFLYNHPRARVLEADGEWSLGDEDALITPDAIVLPPVRATAFADQLDPSFRRLRIVSRKRGKSTSLDYPEEQVRVLRSAAAPASPVKVLEYWRQVLARCDPKDYLRIAHEQVGAVHAGSALAAYLEGKNSPAAFPRGPVLLPFRSNEEQREAVEKALQHQLSVIDGPPGTGKTETILNIIANILAVPGRTVGVVSFGNAAVDNVMDKLSASGLDFAAARLGSRERVARFLAQQQESSARLAQWLARPRASIPAARKDSKGAASGHPLSSDGHLAGHLFEHMRASERRLVEVWRTTRSLAQVRNSIEAYVLEAAHFERRAADDPIPELTGLPLLKKNSGRLVEYLAEVTLQPDLPGGLRGFLPRLRRYFKYGRLRDLDPRDAASLLRLERAFYASRIAELREDEEGLLKELGSCDPEAVRQEHEGLSWAVIDDAIRARYPRGRSIRFSGVGQKAPGLLDAYPVLLSTCHSLRWNLAEGELLDWLIIDEATQVSVLAAALAMSCARNVVVVGDLQQLGHFLDPVLMRDLPDAPRAPYDVRKHSILSSVIELYGEQLPRTMLREHFRCSRQIIEFCNQMYYDGALIPSKIEPAGTGAPVLAVRKTVPGNHARKLVRGSERGTYNQREIDEILYGLLLDAGVSSGCDERDAQGDYELGFTTPYRLQADRLTAAISSEQSAAAGQRWLAETVHKFQGRGAREMILSTVIDDSLIGRKGLRFVDDFRLINVAVSRAKERFTLVTSHGELPRSTHIKALIDYIRFLHPDHIVEGQVVSVFDLLYREHSERLKQFALRVHGASQFHSENILWTLLGDILKDPAYRLLEANPQVRLRDLLPDLSRLDERQRRFVRSVSAVDFAVHHRVTRRMLLAIEVNGTAYHEDNPVQRARDEMKESILNAYDVPVLSLPTNGSGEELKIRAALDEVLEARNGL